MRQLLPYWRLQAMAVVNPGLREQEIFSNEENKLTSTTEVFVGWLPPPYVTKIKSWLSTVLKQANKQTNNENNNNKQKLL